jgi:hypothetical protein
MLIAVGRLDCHGACSKCRPCDLSRKWRVLDSADDHYRLARLNIGADLYRKPGHPLEAFVLTHVFLGKYSKSPLGQPKHKETLKWRQ